MANNTNPIQKETWQRIVDKVGDEVAAWYSNFWNRFKKVPNEHTMTDMFLYNLSIALEKDAPGGTKFQLMDIATTTQREEGTVGYDYCWEFRIADNFSTNVNINRRVVVYLQAKVLKDIGNGQWDSGFTYKTKNNGLQMNLLDKHIKAQRAELQRLDKTVWVVGGYICYGLKHTKYISIKDVIQGNGQNATTSDPIDKRLATQVATNDDGYPLAKMAYESM